MTKGRADRIAIVHAVYGLAWAGCAFAIQPGLLAVLLIAAGASLFAISIARVRRSGQTPPPDERATGSGILRINVTTGVAIVVTILALHGLHTDRLLIAAILAVMAVHFLPLWMLLHRPSLAMMGAALAGATVLAVTEASPGPATMIASLTFLVNCGRIIMTRTERMPE